MPVAAVVPGATMPPRAPLELGATVVTEPLTVPVPDNVPPAFTVTALAPNVDPITRKLPSPTVVAPLYEFAPESTSNPGCCFEIPTFVTVPAIGAVTDKSPFVLSPRLTAKL